jgi:hypothetical protein
VIGGDDEPLRPQRHEVSDVEETLGGFVILHVGV